MNDTDVISDEDEGFEVRADLSGLRNDVRIQCRRLKAVADKVEKGTLEGYNVVGVLRELHGNVLPLLGDLIDFCDRLEQHASWASAEIETLRGDGENASQLSESDADRYVEFLVMIRQECDAMLVQESPGSAEWQRFHERKQQVNDLLMLTENLRLVETDDDDDGGDDTESSDDDAAADAAPEADISTGPTAVPPPEDAA